MDKEFFCNNCSYYVWNETPGRDGKYHGHCGFNGCREDYKGNPTESMIRNCKWDRDDYEYWLSKIK